MDLDPFLVEALDEIPVSRPALKIAARMGQVQGAKDALQRLLDVLNHGGDRTTIEDLASVIRVLHEIKAEIQEDLNELRREAAILQAREIGW